jgi:ferric-dicitrate binding protein FerR (iron transport regulator)
VSLALLKAGSLLPRRDALSYRERSGAETGQWIETNLEPMELDFSDGTVVMVDRATKAKLSDATRDGPRFRLISGRMAFQVVPHAAHGLWLVDAGPFQIRVTGTIFTVEWMASEGSLRVDVTRGHVVVEGAGERRELGPGDSFHHRDTPAVASEPPAVSSATRRVR